MSTAIRFLSALAMVCVVSMTAQAAPTSPFFMGSPGFTNNPNDPFGLVAYFNQIFSSLSPNSPYFQYQSVSGLPYPSNSPPLNNMGSMGSTDNMGSTMDLSIDMGGPSTMDMMVNS